MWIAVVIIQSHCGVRWKARVSVSYSQTQFRSTLNLSCFNQLDNTYLFMVSDDDWDYRRESGVCIDPEHHLSIIFQSTIGGRVVPSPFKVKPNEWHHIALVQKRSLEENVPQQHLWINGQLALSTPMPIASYCERAVIDFNGLESCAHFVGDISIWSRCLTTHEIRAIAEQRTSMDKVDLSKYIFANLPNYSWGWLFSPKRFKTKTVIFFSRMRERTNSFSSLSNWFLSLEGKFRGLLCNEQLREQTKKRSRSLV